MFARGEYALFGTKCRSGSTAMSVSFARGLRSTKPVAKDRREFAIAVAKQDKIFKVFGFIYSLRQFSEPYSAQSADRIQLPCRVRQKSERDTQGVPFAFFGGTDGS